MSADREQTCDQRIVKHLASRLTDIRALEAGSQVYDADTLSEIDDEALSILFNEVDIDRENVTPDQVQEAADEAIDSYALGVSKRTVYRVELSTGGPADWFEVIVDPDSEEVERIVYHFADWFDHAEENLTGDELDDVTGFVGRLIGLDL